MFYQELRYELSDIEEEEDLGYFGDEVNIFLVVDGVVREIESIGQRPGFQFEPNTRYIVAGPPLGAV